MKIGLSAERFVAPDGGEIVPISKPQPDGKLVKALARASRWQKLLDCGVNSSVTEVAKAEGIKEQARFNPATFFLLRTIVDPPGEPEFRGGVVWLHRTPTVSKTVNLLTFPSRAPPGPGLDVADVRQPAAAANSLDFDYHDQLLDLRPAGCPSRERRHPPRPSTSTHCHQSVIL